MRRLLAIDVVDQAVAFQHMPEPGIFGSIGLRSYDLETGELTVVIPTPTNAQGVKGEVLGLATPT